MECLLPYLCMVTVPHIMVGLERMLDYRGAGLARFHCMYVRMTLSKIKWSLRVFRSVITLEVVYSGTSL